MKAFLAGITLLFPIAAATIAATLTVTSHDDSGPGSLRDAIANAAPGDSITFGLPTPDTITLTTDGLQIDKDLTITGPGADLLTWPEAALTALRLSSFSIFSTGPSQLMD